MSTPSAGTPGTNTVPPSGDQGATPPGTPPAGNTPPAQPPSGDSGQGDDATKLKAALDRERQLRKDAEKRAKDGEAAKARADELEQAGKSDTEKAVAAARREAAAETMAKANGRLVAAEARAAAAALRFQDPRDATALIDLSDVRVAEDGTVDTDAITARLDQLAKDKPYLVASATPPEPQGPRPPKPDPSQGSGRAPAPASGSKGAAEAARRYGNRPPAPAGTSTT